MIEAFNLIGDMSAKDMSEKMLALYQKVIDSVPFDRMDDNELHVEDLLVLAGAVGGDAKIDVSQEYVALIKSLTVRLGDAYFCIRQTREYWITYELALK